MYCDVLSFICHRVVQHRNRQYSSLNCNDFGTGKLVMCYRRGTSQSLLRSCLNIGKCRLYYKYNKSFNILSFEVWYNGYDVMFQFTNLNLSNYLHINLNSCFSAEVKLLTSLITKLYTKEFKWKRKIMHEFVQN